MDVGFDSVAAYYELLSDNEARLKREGPFLRECLEQAPGKGVVDVGCGTGLHAWFLAELGAQVTAVDVSAEMIAYAQAHRSHEGIRYETGDMREARGGPYDLAFCLGNSLCLLPGLADVERAFASVAAALSPGGRFVAQILNYASEANREPRHRIEVKRRDNTDIVAVKSLVPRGGRTLLSLAFFALGTGPAASVSETSVLLNLTLAQLAACAENAGLRQMGVYGSYGQSEYEPSSSSDLVCIFEKPGEP